MNLISPHHNSPEMQSMIRAYMVCLLWTMPGPDDDENPGDRFTIDRFTREARIVCIADCLEFLNRVRQAGLVTWLYGTGPEFTGYGPDNLGHDLALSRNGHGAGFFDRKALELDAGLWATIPRQTGRTLGDTLQDIARGMGERDCGNTRGWVYVD